MIEIRIMFVTQNLNQKLKPKLKRLSFRKSLSRMYYLELTYFLLHDSSNLNLIRLFSSLTFDIHLKATALISLYKPKEILQCNLSDHFDIDNDKKMDKISNG
jgi:hypothetical protein